jgi:hypothetical protein
LALVVYAGLDLSLPAMPGAFVFEVAESADLQVTRGRATVDPAVLPALASAVIIVWAQPRVEGSVRRPAGELAPRRAHAMTWLPRAPGDPPPPSDNPH